MTNTTMINYSTRDFATEVGALPIATGKSLLARSHQTVHCSGDASSGCYSDLDRKEQSYRVGIVFEYRDQDAYVTCQGLLKEIPPSC